MKNKKILLIVATVCVLATGAIWAFSSRSSNKEKDIDTTPSPSIEADVKDAEDHKAALADEKTQDNDNSSGGSSSSSKKTVSVVITTPSEDLGNTQYEIRGYAEAFEASGTCNLTMKKGSTSVSVSKEAVQNISTMSCGAMKISRSKLSTGTWEATLSYSSDSSQGSEVTKVEVM